MSGFDNGTNRGRVAKTIEILELIEKSARSNRVEAEEIAALLAPIVAKVKDLTGEGEGPSTSVQSEIEAAPEVMSRPGNKEARWYRLRKEAEEAPLEDLLGVVAVIFDRVGVAIHQLPREAKGEMDKRTGK